MNLDGKPLLQQFYDDMEAVLSRYINNGLNFSEFLGSIELLKLEFWSAQKADEEDEFPGAGDQGGEGR